MFACKNHGARRQDTHNVGWEISRQQQTEDLWAAARRESERGETKVLKSLVAATSLQKLATARSGIQHQTVACLRNAITPGTQWPFVHPNRKRPLEFRTPGKGATSSSFPQHIGEALWIELKNNLRVCADVNRAMTGQYVARSR